MNSTIDVPLIEADGLGITDTEHFPYLLSAQSLQDRLKNGIAIRRFVVGEDEFKVTDELKEGLEKRTNKFFFDRCDQLVNDYKSSHLWNNFRYMVVLVNKSLL